MVLPSDFCDNCFAYNAEVVTIFQGIIGADGRHYILDLFRTFPPDANFLGGMVFKSLNGHQF